MNFHGIKYPWNPHLNCLQSTQRLAPHSKRTAEAIPSPPSSMHLAQQLRKSSNGDQLIGLIDGVAAIVLTLLVIEMPVIIIQALESAESTRQIYLSIAMNAIGYFLVSLIVYDIWSIQKSLSQSARSSASQNLTCISTLWLSTLIPPMLYVAEHF